MAAKTFEQLYTDALTQADETEGSSAATALSIIQSGINESYAEVAGLRDWPTLQNTTTFSTTSGTNEYTPVTASSTVCRIRRVISIIDETNKHYLTEEQRDRFNQVYPYVNTSTDIGIPSIWYESGYTSSRDINVKLYKVPDGTYTMRVFFYEEPLELSADADVPRIPDQFHYGLTYVGLAKYYEYQKDLVTANQYRQMHNDFKRKITTIETGFSDEMPAIRPVTQKNGGYIIGKIGRVYN